MQRPSLLKLLRNHMDAWQVALTIAAVALLIHDAISARTLGLLAAIGAGYWLAFALNDYFDAPADALDARKAAGNFFAHPACRSQNARIFLLLLNLGLMPAFLPFGWTGLAFFAVACAVMWSYSAPPLRLKNRPGFDLLLHALFVQTYPYVMVAALAGGRLTRLDSVMVAMLLLASLAAQLEQQIRDYEVDRINGRTFTTVIGRRPAAILLRGVTGTLIAVAFLFVANGTIPLFLLPLGLIGLPALLDRFLRHSAAPRREKLVHASTTMGMVYVGGVFCYFLLK